ncbi:MAG: RNA 3'-terminal phosphate cyclase [Gemmataceae bacterium]|nr:RNA 3'-terminal phosphate cyclase [Gemmataceae bacterium]MDW8264137.1 RNA 3'-terminal phosphate cyclase [Gemmataceae bacterium]
MARSWVELDGGLGEGGGQILRTALTLSLLTGRGFHLTNIRAGRAKPGLQPQHLTCVHAAAAIAQGKTQGAVLGSSELIFEPGAIQAGTYHFAVGTAGATGLVLHTVALPLALGVSTASDVTLSGGTHVRASPSFHFNDITWRAYLQAMGVMLRQQLVRPGFYPRGGGVVRVRIEPSVGLRPLQLRERGPIRSAGGFSAVAGLPSSIAQRQARRAVNRLRQAGLEAHIREETWPNGPGTVLAIQLDTEPAPTLFVGLGERGKPAERVADEAADQALAYARAAPAAVDPYSADQLVLPLALANGPSSFTVSEVTSHLRTNVEVVRRFLDRTICCEGDIGQPGEVVIP